MEAELAEALWSWRKNSGYPNPEDWVFASPAKDGKQPYWPGTLYWAHFEPAAKAAGFPGKIGWHTFRHTFATLLKANGEDIKTVQELLSHANISVTMNVYAQGVTELKRIVRMVTGRKDEESRERLNGRKRTQDFEDAFSKSFVLLASPTGFEPVLSP
jgi:integrase